MSGIATIATYPLSSRACSQGSEFSSDIKSNILDSLPSSQRESRLNKSISEAKELMQQKKLEEAIVILNTTDDQLEESDNLVRSRIMVYFSSCYFQLGKLERALFCCEEGLRISTSQEIKVSFMFLKCIIHYGFLNFVEVVNSANRLIEKYQNYSSLSIQSLVKNAKIVSDECLEKTKLLSI